MSNNKLETLLCFPKGIPGFEEYLHYKLAEEEDSPLANLVSTENSEAGFILFRSQFFFSDYLSSIELAADEIELLGIVANDPIEVWSILTLCQSDMIKTTVNLRAPILVNRRTRKGAQFILSDDHYSPRQPLFSDWTKPAPNEGGREGAVG